MKFSIRNKILTGYFLILILVIIVWGWGIFLIKDLGKSAELILTENYMSIEAAFNMINSINRQNSIQLQSLFKHSNNLENLFRNDEIMFLQWLGRAKDNITIESESEIINKIEKDYPKYLAISSDFFLKIKTSDPEAENFYEDTLKNYFRVIVDECTKLADLNHNTMYSASRITQDVALTSFYGILVIGIVTITTGILFSIFISFRLSKPIQSLVEVTKKIGYGNLDVDIDINSTDEIGLLAQELRGMVQKLKDYRDFNVGKIVTERKRVEAIIQSVGDAILVFDKDFNLVLVNQAAENVLNFKCHEAIGRHFLEVLNDESLFNRLKEVIEKGKTIPIKEGEDVFIFKKNMEKIYYYFSLNPVKLEREKIIGAVLLLKDISKLKELEKMKSDFVTAASHELKNPLSSVTMAVNLLLEKEHDEKDNELLIVARDECQRLESIIADLLDLSKIDSGEIKMEYQEIDIAYICQKAMDVFKKQAEEKGVTIKLIKEKEFLPRMHLDATKITWVLTNLIGNAICYTNEAGYIRVRVNTVEGRMFISVEDNGEGIPYEYQSRIFDKFISFSNKVEKGQSGLGLPIAKEIIKAHGGNIWLEKSEPGKGSVFTFTLPLVQG